MHDEIERLAGGFLIGNAALEREFEVLVSDALTLVFRVAYGVLRHREDAEDVTQEAFAQAHRHFHALRDRTAFRAWMVRTTWRLALRRLRADRRRTAREQLTASAQAIAAWPDGLEHSERAAQLWKAIDTLPPKLRIVTILAGIEEHDTREVAALLGLSIGTVKSRLFLARQRLRELLQWIR